MKDIYRNMNRQNILNFYGSKLDLRLDSSELYDFELTKDTNYNGDVLDLSTPIVYSSLKIDNNLNNMDCVKTTITLVEDDINDLLYPYLYLGLYVTLPYNDFVSNFGTGFTYTILDSNRFKLTLLNNEVHYFKIYGYNYSGLTSSGLTVYSQSQIISGFTNVYKNRKNIISPRACSPQAPKTNAKPWAYKFDEGLGIDNCEFLLKRRVEDGWSLNFVFNRDSLPWSAGGVFYYTGVRGDDDLSDYADNNLSFQFTNDGRIKWISKHYSGACINDTSYNESFYISSGQTPKLCTTGLTTDFNVTIVFDRYKHYTGCDIENDGGWNDLIIGPHPTDYIINTGVTAVTSTQVVTGYLITNSLDVLTGATPTYQYNEELNKKWADERNQRLGTLKIYLNGRLIYKLKDWEEIVPSKRGDQPFIQSWGGGTGLMGGIHQGICCFKIKSIKYFEEPLDFIHVNHHYLTSIKPNYSIIECGDNCVDTIIGLITPSPTPTHAVTQTPTNTPTPTGTPTNTPTPSVTPTIGIIPQSPTPTPTPSSTTSGGFVTGPFNFDFDYMVVEYFFTNGTDMDTMTYISNPSIMNNDFLNASPGDYVGTCSSSNNGPDFPTNDPYLMYGGDNQSSQGIESVLFDLVKYKIQRPFDTNIEITFTSTWYGSVGTNPVISRATMWKGGTPVQDGFTYVNTTATATKMVQSDGKVITSNTQNCEAFEEVSKFQFNITNYHGQFI